MSPPLSLINPFTTREEADCREIRRTLQVHPLSTSTLYRFQYDISTVRFNLKRRLLSLSSLTDRTCLAPTASCTNLTDSVLLSVVVHRLFHIRYVLIKVAATSALLFLFPTVYVSTAGTYVFTMYVPIVVMCGGVVAGPFFCPRPSLLLSLLLLQEAIALIARIVLTHTHYMPTHALTCTGGPDMLAPYIR